MSTILKFLLMALAWAVLFLGTYYGCITKEYCPPGENQEVADPPPAVANDYALASSYGSDDVLTGTQWSSMLQGLLDKFNADPTQALEVTGYYHNGENAPEGFENMGLYRADEIKKLLIAKGVPGDNIRMLSQLLTGDRPADRELFDAGKFGWGKMSNAATPNAPELVKVDKDEVKIRFPFDKAAKTLGKEVEDYLKTLAARVKASNETIAIIGHTDNVDTEAYNMKLGQKRADFVRDRLISYGVNSSLISTSSQGENSPESSNASAEGRRINRRAIVTLNRAQ
jgi:OOP family OmpA-OmpF porin